MARPTSQTSFVGSSAGDWRRARTLLAYSFQRKFVNTKRGTVQGDRFSKEGQEPGEVGFLPTGSLELSSKRSFYAVLLHDVQGHVAQNGEIVGTVSQAAPVLILVHDDVEAPMQAIFDAPVRADDIVESFGRQWRAEQIVGGLGRRLAGGFAEALDLADRDQARPAKRSPPRRSSRPIMAASKPAPPRSRLTSRG